MAFLGWKDDNGQFQNTPPAGFMEEWAGAYAGVFGGRVKSAEEIAEEAEPEGQAG